MDKTNRRGWAQFLPWRDRPEYPWRSAALVGVIYLLFLLGVEHPVVWGLLLLLFVIPMLISGVTFMVEEIPQVRFPVLYWLVMGVWIIAGLFPITIWILEFR